MSRGQNVRIIRLANTGVKLGVIYYELRLYEAVQEIRKHVEELSNHIVDQ